MKKCLLVLLLLSALVLSAGCQNKSIDTPNTETGNFTDSTATFKNQSSAPQKVEIVEIIDIAERDKIPCDTALEKFYSDTEYSYYYSCIKSEYVIVRYSDGTEETVENALKNNKISINDLDRFNILYHKYDAEYLK